VACLFSRLSTIIRYICTNISSVPAEKFPHIYIVVKGVSGCSFICDTVTIDESIQVSLMDYIVDTSSIMRQVRHSKSFEILCFDYDY
jgi:hypothetical protein